MKGKDDLDPITNPPRMLEIYKLYSDATSANTSWNEILIVGLFESNLGELFLADMPSSRTDRPVSRVVFKMFGFVTPTLEACEDFTVKVRVPIKRVE